VDKNKEIVCNWTFESVNSALGRRVFDETNNLPIISLGFDKKTIEIIKWALKNPKKIGGERGRIAKIF